MTSTFKTKLRDLACGEINSSLIGKRIAIAGWVRKIRNHGGILFIDIRDRTGVVQVIVNPEDENLNSMVKTLKKEFVIQVFGLVRKRPNDQINKSMKTGEVEVLAEKINVLNPSDETPIEVKDDVVITEKNRFKYRYLDLRRPKIQKNILFRHEVVKAVRDFLNSKNFVEIETPLLVKSTPEGARDFLVPSRMHKGKFYALPQSPQLYKQLLMIAGFDRYYQIVKCLRDEDLRADRQPEFTQIDLEMSFVDQEDVMNLTESLIKYVVEKTLGLELNEPFQRMTYDEAMDKYGSDKPDLRFGLELEDVKDAVKILNLRIFEAEAVKALRVDALFSRKKIKEFENIVKLYKARGLAWISLKDGSVSGSLSKFATDEFLKRMNLKEGETIFIVAGDKSIVNTSLGQLRLALGKELNLINEDEFKFLWVTDFPMFEYDDEEKRLVAQHHPFTKPEVVSEELEKHPLSVKALAYDIVLNGWELGGGSIRIENIDLQRRIFKLIGLSDEEAEKKFGFLLEALRYGAPPHGGLAIGLDRLATLLSKQTDIREFIAFPKNKSAENPMDGSPSEVDPRQLEELGISIRK